MPPVLIISVARELKERLPSASTRPEVAGAVPAVGAEGGRGAGRVAEVAAREVAAHLDLADLPGRQRLAALAVGDPHSTPGSGGPCVVSRRSSGQVDGGDAAVAVGLGAAVDVADLAGRRGRPRCARPRPGCRASARCAGWRPARARRPRARPAPRSCWAACRSRSPRAPRSGRARRPARRPPAGPSRRRGRGSRAARSAPRRPRRAAPRPAPGRRPVSPIRSPIAKPFSIAAPWTSGTAFGRALEPEV